jgi:hypothetical protein
MFDNCPDDLTRIEDVCEQKTKKFIILHYLLKYILKIYSTQLQRKCRFIS